MDIFGPYSFLFGLQRLNAAYRWRCIGPLVGRVPKFYLHNTAGMNEFRKTFQRLQFFSPVVPNDQRYAFVCLWKSFSIHVVSLNSIGNCFWCRDITGQLIPRVETRRNEGIKYFYVCEKNENLKYLSTIGGYFACAEWNETLWFNDRDGIDLILFRFSEFWRKLDEAWVPFSRWDCLINLISRNCFSNEPLFRGVTRYVAPLWQRMMDISLSVDTLMKLHYSDDAINDATAWTTPWNYVVLAGRV